ncbi:hypothetical protein C0992_003953 [Termitomyces sp. T32_za158]|nr:hypothetical protein C0992_003953 [Termitomyces sp. T32_za158]
MLTRSHARALAKKEAAARAAVLVSLSTTGKGTHMRRTCAEDEDDRRSKHSIIHIRTRTRTCYKTDHTATCLTGSCSSISSSGESSREETPVITPTSSFNTCVSFPITPQRTNKPLTTPPRLSPKKLQRSPWGRWITANDGTRIVFIEDPQEQASFREMQDEIKSQRIKERELETLLRERDIVNGEKDEDFVMEVATQTSGTWRDQVSSGDISEVNNRKALLAPDVYSCGDILEFRDIALMGSCPRQVRPLDPNEIKLDEPVTFMPHSMGSSQASRVETWRQGVLEKSQVTSSKHFQ